MLCHSPQCYHCLLFMLSFFLSLFLLTFFFFPVSFLLLITFFHIHFLFSFVFHMRQIKHPTFLMHFWAGTKSFFWLMKMKIDVFLLISTTVSFESSWHTSEVIQTTSDIWSLCICHYELKYLGINSNILLQLNVVINIAYRLKSNKHI